MQNGGICGECHVLVMHYIEPVSDFLDLGVVMLPQEAGLAG